MHITRTLKRGMQGEDVRRLQEELKAAGYDPGPVDGNYTEQTEAAVKRLQEDQLL